MKKPEYTKPFDIEHAKAGAPYGCRDGQEATILKWDRRDEYALLGMHGSSDRAISWMPNGQNAKSLPEYELDLVMLPLGFIDGKPVWVGDELADVEDSTRRYTVEPHQNNFDGCRWPAPAPVYPFTRMSSPELTEVFDANLMLIVALENVANFALRHAIDAGQVVLAADHAKALTIIGAAYQVAGAHGASEAVLDVLCDPMAATDVQIDAMLPYEAPNDAARDLAVAQAVHHACHKALIDGQLHRADLPAIIAGVAK